MGRNKELSKKFRKFFHMPSSPVAVNISTEAGEDSNVESAGRFCQFVRKAAFERKEYTIEEDDLSNFTPKIMLGFSEPQYVDIYPRIKPVETQSIKVAPFEASGGEPDVIIVIGNPARLMEILQILHNTTKDPLEASCTGEGSAIAGEATALPYMEGKPNLTLLCGGARTIGGFEDDELAFGIPFDVFQEVAASLTEPELTDALCGCLMDDIPDHIKNAFMEMGFEKGTDHFFGEFEGKLLRFYIDQGDRGRLSKMTVHYPLKLKSKEEAAKLLETAKGILSSEGSAMQRENWLDLVYMADFSEGLEKVALDKEEFKKEISDLFSNFVNIINEISTGPD